MNPHIAQLQPYPFEQLKQLLQVITPPANKIEIKLSLGEPQHPTPLFIQTALHNYRQEMGKYPSTQGLLALRQTIAKWLSQRFQLAEYILDPTTQVLPASGTREALFSFAQCLIDSTEHPVVIMPNPFYQIYEGAALLAGAEPYYLNTTVARDYLPDFDAIPEDILKRCQLFYICSPSNPCGSIIGQKQHQQLIELAESYDFVIAADECYSEIYADEQNPPQGLLQSAFSLGNKKFKRCVVFHSLSKRSNAAGLRSGFVAGDAELLSQFLRYRTYHGCTLPLPTQHASIEAWKDEVHVLENRELYRQKYVAVLNILKDSHAIVQAPAGFYIWFATPIKDTDFACMLYQQQHVVVLPGSFLARLVDGINPGQNYVRMALVVTLADCIAAAQRIKNFLLTL